LENSMAFVPVMGIGAAAFTGAAIGATVATVLNNTHDQTDDVEVAPTSTVTIVEPTEPSSDDSDC
jgi:hypothetical protein